MRSYVSENVSASAIRFTLMRSPDSRIHQHLYIDGIYVAIRDLTTDYEIDRKIFTKIKKIEFASI